jgi:hypothetical protein
MYSIILNVPYPVAALLYYLSSTYTHARAPLRIRYPTHKALDEISAKRSIFNNTAAPRVPVPYYTVELQRVHVRRLSRTIKN